MNLLNYTSEVPPEKSIAEIESLLAKAGASHVGKSYNGAGEVDGFYFQIRVHDRLLPFRLPCHPEKVEAVLKRAVKRPRSGTLKRIAAQSRRTAWRILRDWVEVQVTMILLEQVDPLEVFLAYTLDQTGEHTFYEKLQETNFKLLSPPEVK